MKTKFCKKCLETKEVTEFYKQKGMKDGRQNTCKVCIRERSRQWRIKNPKPKKIPGPRMDGFRLLPEGMRKCSVCDEVKEKKYFYKNSSRASGVNSRCKRCTNEHKKEMRQSSYRPDLEVRRKWKEENRERLREKDREYKEKNRTRIALNAGKRRARKESLPDDITYEETEDILKHFERKCAICESDFEHLDHFIPLSSEHGGTTKENIVPMCSFCNISKGGKNPFEWKRLLSDAERNNFDELIKYLESINGVSDYRNYVNSCFENKTTN